VPYWPKGEKNVRTEHLALGMGKAMPPDFSSSDRK